MHVVSSTRTSLNFICGYAYAVARKAECTNTYTCMFLTRGMSQKYSRSRRKVYFNCKDNNDEIVIKTVNEVVLKL